MIVNGKQMNELTPIQKEIVTALEQMKEKSLITEANLAKKIRENAKIQGKNKAGICLKDLEVCIEYLGENSQLPYALHLNSANDILIKKVGSDGEAGKMLRGSSLSETPSSCIAREWKLLEGDAKKRRQSSEKSISVLTNGDLRQKASGGKVVKKRTDRKKMSFRDVEEFD
ncbi:MAG: hypothetical protein K6G52_00125 [Treponemataceae bacterium]|nr:hypothetical protein [Treponemataceae bacterium]